MAKDPVMRRSPIRPNPERRAKTWASRYGSIAYVKHLESRPCDLCGVRGYSVAAHVPPRSAGGRKENQVSLCYTRPDWSDQRHDIIGCHDKVDAHRIPAEVEERLRGLGPKLYAEFHGESTNEVGVQTYGW